MRRGRIAILKHDIGHDIGNSLQHVNRVYGNGIGADSGNIRPAIIEPHIKGMLHRAGLNIFTNEVCLKDSVLVASLSAAIISRSQVVLTCCACRSQCRNMAPDGTRVQVGAGIRHAHAETVSKFAREVRHVCQGVGKLTVA
ncbi:hypothetical protein SDC9_127086 [bioreactor metagenome]|uniref:Uncharacterized protein n=1 Tax=bioreactor metagenome TaxID=1076179 RepID=A0A645CTL4_9ZZZZ